MLERYPHTSQMVTQYHILGSSLSIPGLVWIYSCLYVGGWQEEECVRDFWCIHKNDICKSTFLFKMSLSLTKWALCSFKRKEDDLDTFSFLGHVESQWSKFSLDRINFVSLDRVPGIQTRPRWMSLVSACHHCAPGPAASQAGAWTDMYCKHLMIRS